jgi:hypothetical protein
MPNRIPQEFLVLISSFLTLKDKLHLIATCGHVFNVISNTNLFSELDLLNRAEQMEDIVDRFISNQYSGLQVKQLSFDIEKVPEQLLVQLLAVFPNVTQLRTQRYHTQRENPQGEYFTDIALQWKDTLEIYDMGYDWIEILPILKTNIFTHLTEFVLGGAYGQHDKKDGFDIPYFIPHIKNAPALRKLALDNCTLDLDFLEQIHTSCPLLRSLELMETHIFVKNDTVLAPIIPADSLLYLDLDSNFIFDLSGLLLDYITTKYRCLIILDFTFYDEYHTGAFSGYHDVDVDDVCTNSEDERDDEDMDVPEIRGMIFKKKWGYRWYRVMLMICNRIQPNIQIAQT